MAVYSQATFHLTDQLDLIGGLRITQDKKHGIDTTGFTTSGAVPFRYRNSKPTWLLGLNYQAAAQHRPIGGDGGEDAPSARYNSRGIIARGPG